LLLRFRKFSRCHSFLKYCFVIRELPSRSRSGEPRFLLRRRTIVADDASKSIARSRTRKRKTKKAFPKTMIDRKSMTRVDDSRSGTLIATSTLVSSPFSRTILLETSRTRRARGGSRCRRREGSVTLRALLVSCVTTLAAPCAAQSFSTRTDILNALRSCNPSWSSSETFANCQNAYGVHISDWDVSSVDDMSYSVHW